MQSLLLKNNRQQNKIMGCDIHVYIEYKSKNHKDGYAWNSFGGRINPGRNYAMFALLAGVRNYDAELPVTFPLRGTPNDAGYKSSSDNQMYISDTSEGEDYVKSERAKQWVESGSSKYINNHEGKPTWVTHPDWHSHSWLTTSEFESIIHKYLELETEWSKQRVEEHNKYVKEHNIQPTSWAYEPPEMNFEPEYQAVLAAMQRLEYFGKQARIVFWFDN